VSIHQLVDAQRIADRFLLLDHGRVLIRRADASLEEVFLALD
jgi:ABC-type multidrug transport system ATPase subunit